MGTVPGLKHRAEQGAWLVVVCLHGYPDLASGPAHTFLRCLIRHIDPVNYINGLPNSLTSQITGPIHNYGK